eukprot:COSAG04_NODE_1110_length_8228_cov_3.329315_9_plen_101_part_00
MTRQPGPKGTLLAATSAAAWQEAKRNNASASFFFILCFYLTAFIAVRVDRGPLSPLSSLPWGALLRRAVRRAGNALRDGSGAAVKRVVAVAARRAHNQER